MLNLSRFDKFIAQFFADSNNIRIFVIQKGTNKNNLKIKIMNLNKDAAYYLRFTDHIDEDLKRGWSSWNFGLDGFKGSKDELIEAIEENKSAGYTFTLSGVEMWLEEDTIVNSDYDAVYFLDNTARELYPNYWVIVDEVNATNGLSAHELPEFDTLDEVLSEIKKNPSRYDGTGDGDSFDASRAKVVFSGVDNRGYNYSIIECN